MDYFIKKKDAVCLFVFCLLCVCMSHFEFYLFDNANYLRSISDVVSELKSFRSIN